MILRFTEGDVIQLKKAHPCGSAMFRVLRTGSDIRIKCEGCGREYYGSACEIRKKCQKDSDKGRRGGLKK